MTRAAPLCTLLAAAAVVALSGCGNSVERSYSNCVEAAHKQTIAGGKGLPPDLAKNFEKASRAIAEKNCSIIRDECRNDPQAESCQSLIKQYGK